MKSITKLYDIVKAFMKENWKFFLAVIAIVFIFEFELPYVIYKPGGSIDLSDRITVDNGYESQGSFSMAYVSMVKGNIPFLLFSYLMPNWDIVSEDDLKPDNETLDEMIKADHISLLQAQNHAIFSAFRLAGKEVKIKNKTNHVVYISEEAQTDLKLFDELLRVDGREVTSLEEMQKYVSSLKKKNQVDLLVRRDGKEIHVSAIPYEVDGTLKIGVAITTTYEYETDPSVTIHSKSSESGPSGGLMMALSIYNSLCEKDITGGRKIIGTGTIDEDGNVGEIGGVKYKLLGAAKKKADVFLVPEGNYDEAVEVKNKKNLDIRIISVKTLEDAVKALL